MAMTAPIQNVIAEKQVLGSLMQQPNVAERVFAVISPDDFHHPAHAFLAAVLHRRFLAGEPMHATAVLTAATADGTLGKIGGGPYLFELIQQVEVPASAPLLAEDIRRHATRRELVEIGTRLVQQANNDTCEPLAVTTETQAQLADVTEAELITGNVTVPTLTDFLGEEDQPEDWVIPGLLAREDRMILTGAEGLGKMMLLRQIAVCAAAGLDPFTYAPIEPRTVLLVDLENPAQIMRQTIRKMVDSAKVKSARHDVADRVFVERRPEGLNLAEPSNVAWLMKRVTMCQPDILIIGPLYKLMNDNPNDEATARACTVALDLIRTRGNCALLLEAHAGHGSNAMTDRPVRPTGSSLWLRWPEFGMGLRRAKTDDAQEFRRVEVVPWRGARGERDWPTELIADARFAFQPPTFSGRAA
jgi:replicative DNA helicase